ncbi:TVP38/TMEM64 family protein [Lacticaseibacillus camelliae]|uniref:TVP38/TMEM64 family protein n=1 Tax=Lacticaseibacillus camelliae TaxID=381742 RepID=UPI0006D1CD25|nr:TVP38/TMEM64 family protein [Lacticaseibacillus camelliae]
MGKTSETTSRRLINLTALCSVVAIVFVTIYWYRIGVFHDLASLHAYINSTGLIGPLIFILIQVVQVVIPIIPGGVSTAAGVILFGPWQGFLYNYIGIVIGSFINFFLARNYGKPFILHIVSEKVFDKYMAYAKNQQKFDTFFAIAIVAPVAPDDVLCLIAGLTHMKFKFFAWVIILGKPITIAVYSMSLVFGAHWLLHLFHR